jgi:hypothetical protein
VVLLLPSRLQGRSRLEAHFAGRCPAPHHLLKKVDQNFPAKNKNFRHLRRKFTFHFAEGEH